MLRNLRIQKMFWDPDDVTFGENLGVLEMSFFIAAQLDLVV